MDWIENKVRGIIRGNIKFSDIADSLGSDDDLAKHGMNSLEFIRIIVEVENTFGFEFADKDLTVKTIGNINRIVDYIKANIEGAEKP